MNKTIVYPEYRHSNKKKKEEEEKKEETWSRKHPPFCKPMNPQPKLPSK